ncbi:hypothetical protein HPP92_015539 [Vanilla planifolia]|uniref:Uncharacterized protein n=1 Tax=Vanilla planifolia TaxID=51239 RepID=A0A835QTT2_VANPL|nr:hypothetical protein HPP92_015539 [Vanilla planifolia]
MAYEDMYLKDQRPKVDCLVFDLDDTLYPVSSGIAAEVLKNIHGYMVEKLGIEKGKVSDVSNLLYRNYGTTMAGLRAMGYSFDYDDYHSFVHGRLPYEKLKTDPVLRHLLLSLPIRKVIFTNADKVHAAKVLSRLGLEDCFEGIICFETLNEGSGGLFAAPILCKPSEFAMEHALRLANIAPQRAVFLDDSVRNIQAGKSIGLRTVLVGSSCRVKGADHVLESIHNLREALPELWEEAEKAEDVRFQSKVAMEASVIA